MLKLGVPKPVIEMKMKTEGHDPSVLSLDPEGPASAAGGAPKQQAPAITGPPNGVAPTPPTAGNGLDAESKALVTVRNEGSESDEDDDDEFDE